MSSMLDYMQQDPATIQIPGAPTPGGAPEPADTGAAPAGASPEDDPISLLKQALDALTQYQQVEPDAVDKATAAKLAAQIHSLLAKDQQDRDQAGSPALNPRLLRKAGAIT